MENFFVMIEKERECQDNKWGIQRYEYNTWLTILTEEVGEVARAILDFQFNKSNDSQDLLQNLEIELVQVAAVCKAMFEQIHEQRKPI